MTERLLQYLWQFQYFNRQALTTTDGQPLAVLAPGLLNTNQGTDFNQCRITIGNTTWAGNIELHIFSSDWLKHGHQHDGNYQNVILHVVWEHDRAIPDALGNALPTLELKHRVAKSMLMQYEQWMNTHKQIPCGQGITQVPELSWKNWLQRLTIERLMHKHQGIAQHLAQTQNHWEEVFWRILCRYFGGNVNRTSFEQIAMGLPIELLAKHKHQIHQLEALLLGQAGLLHKHFEEQYPRMLYREYQYLQKKYGLRVVNLPPSFLRMRPINFPTVRLAQLAQLIHQSSHLFATIKAANTPKDIEPLLKPTANDYWHYHYRFDEPTAFLPKQLGTDMYHIITINAIVPTLFAYGLHTDNSALKDKALAWLEILPAEKNSKIAPLTQLGVVPKSAFESQALLQLKTNWCDAKACLNCSVGHYLLRQANKNQAL
ncbi:MAG: DUF2851 family protein [Bacteroidetes bacterium]|nr:MAG: DUF2851 family protein [Bacteroidota bacterium]